MVFVVDISNDSIHLEMLLVGTLSSIRVLNLPGYVKNEWKNSFTLKYLHIKQLPTNLMW